MSLFISVVIQKKTPVDSQIVSMHFKEYAQGHAGSNNAATVILQSVLIRHN